MVGSYEIINYSLRPAKQIERKMICEAAKRLGEFALLESYRYVGFGSVFFSDFAMVHRQLNISKLISIEKDVHKQERFDFNKPFACIELKFGESSSILPQLTWHERTILWLDYDGRLEGDCIEDVASFCANAPSGSMLILSANAQTPSEWDDPVQQYSDSVGSSFVANGTTKADFAGWNFAKTIRRSVTSAIAKTLSDRNGILSEYDKFTWHQILSFDYQDGAKMTTIGGVLSNKGERPHFEKCSFASLSYCRQNQEESYKIDVPSLTWRELRYLDQQLPLAEGKELQAPGISSKALKQYAAVYRYYPNFAETEHQ